jgi:hypothetical protein
MKVLLAISVSREWVETEFLQQMGKWDIPKDCQVKMGWFRQFTAAERHNVAMFEAKYNYDRILFMDTDQIYPYDYITRMLAHDEPVVSGLNVSRYEPFEITTYKVESEYRNGDIVLPRCVAYEPPVDEPLFECDVTGTGALMLDPKIVESLEVPYFKDLFKEDGTQRLLPDDFYFGWKLWKAGIKIVVDQTIIVKHIVKIPISPINKRDIKNAWEKITTGYGIVKDGRPA